MILRLSDVKVKPYFLFCDPQLQYPSCVRISSISIPAWNMEASAPDCFKQNHVQLFFHCFTFCLCFFSFFFFLLLLFPSPLLFFFFLKVCGNLSGILLSSSIRTDYFFQIMLYDHWQGGQNDHTGFTLVMCVVMRALASTTCTSPS